MSRLLDLAPELFEQIFHNFVEQASLPDIFHSRAVCKTFSRYIDHELLVKVPRQDIKRKVVNCGRLLQGLELKPYSYFEDRVEGCLLDQVQYARKNMSSLPKYINKIVDGLLPFAPVSSDTAVLRRRYQQDVVRVCAALDLRIVQGHIVGPLSNNDATRWLLSDPDEIDVSCINMLTAAAATGNLTAVQHFIKGAVIHQPPPDLTTESQPKSSKQLNQRTRDPSGRLGQFMGHMNDDHLLPVVPSRRQSGWYLQAYWYTHCNFGFEDWYPQSNRGPRSVWSPQSPSYPTGYPTEFKYPLSAAAITGQLAVLEYFANATKLDENKYLRPQPGPVQAVLGSMGTLKHATNCAIRARQSAAVKYLIDLDIKLSRQNMFHSEIVFRDMLTLAIESGSTDVLEAISAKALLHVSESPLRKCLRSKFKDACVKGHTDMVQYILRSECVGSIRKQLCSEGLYAALEQGRSSIAILLLEKFKATLPALEAFTAALKAPVGSKFVMAKLLLAHRYIVDREIWSVLSEIGRGILHPTCNRWYYSGEPIVDEVVGDPSSDEIKTVILLGRELKKHVRRVHLSRSGWCGLEAICNRAVDDLFLFSLNGAFRLVAWDVWMWLKHGDGLSFEPYGRGFIAEWINVRDCAL